MLRGGKKSASYRVSSNCLGGGPHTNQRHTLPKIYANRNFASSSNLPAGLNLGMSSTNVSLNCMLAGLGDCSGSWNTFSLGHLRTKTSNPMPTSKQGDPRESSGLLGIASKECQ